MDKRMPLPEQGAGVGAVQQAGGIAARTGTDESTRPTDLLRVERFG
jgi:hypothetical protein